MVSLQTEWEKNNMAKLITENEREVVVEKTYVVELNQKELDVIVTLSGNVVGMGSVREVTNKLFRTLYKYKCGYGCMFTESAQANEDYKFNG